MATIRLEVFFSRSILLLVRNVSQRSFLRWSRFHNKKLRTFKERTQANEKKNNKKILDKLLVAQVKTTVHFAPIKRVIYRTA